MTQNELMLRLAKKAIGFIFIKVFIFTLTNRLAKKYSVETQDLQRL